MQSSAGASPYPPPGIVVRDAKLNNIGRDYNDHHVVNNNIIQQISTKDWRLALLEDHISKGASHDSHERGGLDAPKCHPETRAAVQEQIMGWIGHGEQDERPTRIMWLSGPAGSGKTAIAGSIADTCQEKGWLAASFFFSAFSGPPDRRSKLCLIPTLAYHLIDQNSIPGVREEILSAIAGTPSVFEKRLADQIEILILRPLRSLRGAADGVQWPKVVIVDGLDECGTDNVPGKVEVVPSRQSQEANQREIISVLVQACKDPAFPFRVLLISRPEPVIRDAISQSFISVTPLFLDEKYNPDADIELFFRAKFAEIGRRYNIPEGWLTRDVDVVRTLVNRASGQFIYAATVLRFIQDGKRPPAEQLKRVLEWKAYDTSEPFSSLDLLYLNIVNASPNPPLAIKWLITIDMLREDIGFSTGWMIQEIFEGQSGEMDHILGNLTSLVDLTQGRGHPGPSLNFYHKSFGDFLRDRGRSTTLHELLCSTDATPTVEKAVQIFFEDRVYEIVKRRGSESPHLTLPLDPDSWVGFDRKLCWLLSWSISPRHVYDVADLDWWWSRRSVEDDPGIIPWTYGRVHKDCRWFKCRDTCKIWRKALRRRCRTEGSWHVPTIRDHLVEIFSPYYTEERIFKGGPTRGGFLHPLNPLLAPQT